MFDEDGNQKQTNGMNMIYLPYADDIRPAEKVGRGKYFSVYIFSFTSRMVKYERLLKLLLQCTLEV